MRRPTLASREASRSAAILDRRPGRRHVPMPRTGRRRLAGAPTVPTPCGRAVSRTLTRGPLQPDIGLCGARAGPILSVLLRIASRASKSGGETSSGRGGKSRPKVGSPTRLGRLVLAAGAAWLAYQIGPALIRVEIGMEAKVALEVHGEARVGGGYLRRYARCACAGIGTDRPTPVGISTRGGSIPPAHPLTRQIAVSGRSALRG